MKLLSNNFYSGRFFKTVVLIFSKLVVQCSQLLLFVFLTRLFSKTDYGAFRQIVICFATFLPFCLMGLPSGIIYFYNKNKKLSKTYFYISGIIFSSFLLIAFLFTFFFFREYIEAFLKQEIGIISFLFFWLWGSGILMISVNSLVALKKPIGSAILSFLHATIFVITVFCFSYINQDFQSLIKVYSIAPFCLSVIALIYSYKAIPNELDSSHSSLINSSKELLGYSLPMCFSTSIGGLNRQLPLLIAVAFLTTEEYAVFANGCLQIPFIASVISSAIAVVTPEVIESFNKNKFYDVRNLIYKVSLKTAYIIIPIFLYLFINAREVIIFIFTESYEDAVIPFRILLLAIPSRVMYFGLIFISAGRPGLILLRSIFSLVICMGFAYLISLYNPMLSAFGFIISIYFWAIPFNLFWFKRLLKVQIFNRSHMLNLLFICSVSFMAVTAGCLFKQFEMPLFIYLLTSSVVFFTIYFLFYISYFKKVFSSHELMISKT